MLLLQEFEPLLKTCNILVQQNVVLKIVPCNITFERYSSREWFTLIPADIWINAQTCPAQPTQYTHWSPGRHKSAVKTLSVHKTFYATTCFLV